MSLPIITFSLSPSKLSRLPLIAASVSTRVVSWNEAADKKLSVSREAFVIPNNTGLDVAGRLRSLNASRFASVKL